MKYKSEYAPSHHRVEFKQLAHLMRHSDLIVTIAAGELSSSHRTRASQCASAFNGSEHSPDETSDESVDAKTASTSKGGNPEGVSARSKMITASVVPLFAEYF